MKVFASTLICLTIAAERPNHGENFHPLQRLNTLVAFSQELMDNWYDFLPSQTQWKRKFVTNAARMQRSFARGEQRCGVFDPEYKPHGTPGRKRRAEEVIRYNMLDARVGTKEITTGFRKWAERYIADCSGQKNHQYQINRMNKWNEILQAHLDLNDEINDAINS